MHELLAGFPAATRAADAELAVVAAADELAQGSLEAAERYLMLGDQRSALVPEGRRSQHEILLGIVRLLYARQRGDPHAVTEEAQRLQAAAEAPDAVLTPLGDDLRALALINLGCSEVLAIGFDAARRHLKQGVALARQIRRPFLELTGLAYLALTELVRTPAQTAAAEGQLARVNELARHAIGLAERQGWTGEPAYGIACRAVGSVLAWQARPEEAEPWIRLAERNVTAETEPAAAVGICFARGTVELARGRDREALAAHRAAEQLAGRLTRSNLIILNARAAQLLILARLGETERAEQILVALEEHERDRADVRLVTAGLRLAQGDPRAPTTELAPVLDGSASVLPAIWLAGAFLLEAMARDALSDQDAASRALERALDLAERDGALLWFLLFPVPGLLERQARHGTVHSALVAEVLDLLAGTRPTPAPEGPRPPGEPLSKTELRVLRYLPTHLSAPEMARELFVSPNTVRTHIRSLYAKLGTHHRAETVEVARALGLLAPSRTGRATR